jgi:hypothetical protein
MPRTTLAYFFLFVVFSTITGCALRQPGYLTLTPSTPTIARQGEVRTFGTVSLKHLEGQIAGSPLPHLTLLANGYTGNGARSHELGIGSYIRMGAHFLLDASVFTTKARINSVDTMTTFTIFGTYTDFGRVNAAYEGWALQTNISYGFYEREHDWQPTISAGLKMHFVTYDHYEHFRGYEARVGGFTRGKSWTMPDYMKSEQFYTISITGRAGDERFGVMAQLAFHNAVGRYKPGFIDNGPGYKFFWLTTGVEMYFGPNNKKNKSRGKSVKNTSLTE